MMTAIIPLNVAALRVNNNDVTNIVSSLQGRTASFENMPWYDPASKPPDKASTGDKIYSPLMVVNNVPLSSPADPLGLGVHLHWELPDYFRKGHQNADDASLTFPAAPNRWLVTRFLSFYDAQGKQYGKVSTRSWVVESDYLSPTVLTDADGIRRPMISVPLPSRPRYQQRPYMRMGRVVNAAVWNPANSTPADYLPAYSGADGKPLYLTAVGFVGAYFSSYYPECCSVYGFWDHFADVPYPGYGSLREALQANVAVQFRASYQVAGWLNEANADPLANIDQLVSQQYQAYLQECEEQGVKPEMGATDFFGRITSEQMRWNFNLDNVATADYPRRTVSAGTTQELLWSSLSDPGTSSFLRSNAPATPSLWNAKVELAVGNSIEEAVAAMLRTDMGQHTADPDILTNYELLLDALQLGLLAELEKTPNKLIALEEALHGNAFAANASGRLWIVGSKEVDDNVPLDPNTEVTLPLKLAEQLYLLNRAQKDYDMGRAALNTMRKQLFMDWTHYVKMYTGEIADPHIMMAAMSDFIVGQNGELNLVRDKGDEVGILSYLTDPVTGVVSVAPPVPGVAAGSLAGQVWANYQTVQSELAKHAAWQLQCAKPESFYLPNEPLLLMQGDMMQPVARNSKSRTTAVRLSQEVLSALRFTYRDVDTTLPVSALASVPVVNPLVPLAADVQALLGEACLVTPMLAAQVTDALATISKNNNPALDSPGDFTTSLMYAQGGLNPLEIAPHPGGLPPPPPSSLYAEVHAADYIPAANKVIQVSAPQNLGVCFTNDADNGWAPNGIGWSTQTTPGGFPSQQVNPFLPVFMIWNVRFNPLRRQDVSDPHNQRYGSGNLRDYFQLDTDAVDYVYRQGSGQTSGLTDAMSVTYGNSTTMNPNSTGVLAYQIRSFINAHPGDDDNPTLEKIAAFYAGKRFLAQAVGGFNVQQVLYDYLAQVAVEDLARGGRDVVTNSLANAASEHGWDNWYDYGFNSLAPITSSLLAQNNFGPLRAGFLDVLGIEIVDVFGQRMKLTTAAPGPNQALQVITAASMTPPAGDSVNQGRVYLAPRVLTPTRLWFQWLSSTFDNQVAGVNGDFEALGRHPATSPVCGWTLPNHLDNNLFFYDADGRAIGSFGIENLDTAPVLKYRTRAGNLANPGSDLARDIGPREQPTVNARLATYMWYLNDQNAAYLTDLMTVILRSVDFINPANYAQNTSLAVLIGRPLALVRAVASLETAGRLLPVSMANTGADAPLPQDVNQGRSDYEERMAFSSASLQQVDFPLRMGDLANLDDGLVGYLLEGNRGNPYGKSIFYSPAATADMTGGVRAPDSATLQLQLNAAPLTLTMLVDPRAPVHATTGILPVNQLSIPPDQYAVAMSNLAVSFISRPLLEMAQGLTVPLPATSGYAWSWVSPGGASTQLVANAVTETPVYGYSPQSLQEGWLQLTPNKR